ncbi:asparagine--tRNA ligase [Bacteriovoracaceae bacterium]|nr:asparagine--tRNA ligase [Bacteriovoracaceae bacterium]
MKTVFIKELVANDNLIDQEVTVKGWVRSLRKSKAFSFMVVNDGSSQLNLQIIVDGSTPNYEEVSKLLVGSTVIVNGVAKASQGKNQSVEIQSKSVEIVCANTDDYPLQKKATSFEFLREIAHLRPRTNSFGAVFRVRHTLAKATHDFFHNNNFYYVNTPIITGLDAEGAGEMFRVSTIDLNNIPHTDKKEVDFAQDYFGKETSLCVSGQLEAEALALALGRVYTFGPTFRSENSYTSRHLAEFWMVEPEVSFCNLDQVATLAHDYLKFMAKSVLDSNPNEMDFFNQRIEKGLIEKLQSLVNSEITKITYTEAVKLLENSKKKFEFPVKWGIDLQTEHERHLTDDIYKGPVIVTDYPKKIKAFYMKENDDGETVRAMDLLIPGVGELIGGSQREDSYDKLLNRMNENKMNVAPYQWYLDLRKYGGAEHSGFGLGFERFIMYATGMTNIRDVIPFARTPKSAEF